MKRFWILTPLLILLFARIAPGNSIEHTVRKNESLWKIAKKHYGKGHLWTRIRDANQDRINDPDHVRPGLKLRIPPEKGPLPEWIPPGYEYWKTIRARVPAYCRCRICCGRHANNRTSTGKSARILNGCAVAPAVIPYGTWVKIPGVGWKIADDTGSIARRYSRRGVVQVEIRMKRHRQAKMWGVKWLDVKLYKKKRIQ